MRSSSPQFLHSDLWLVLPPPTTVSNMSGRRWSVPITTTISILAYHRPQAPILAVITATAISTITNAIVPYHPRHSYLYRSPPPLWRHTNPSAIAAVLPCKHHHHSHYSFHHHHFHYSFHHHHWSHTTLVSVAATTTITMVFYLTLIRRSSILIRIIRLRC